MQNIKTQTVYMYVEKRIAHDKGKVIKSQITIFAIFP